MKKYKVLKSDLTSPFQDFQYEIGKEYICEDFDDSDKECSNGFYATGIEGILYSLNYSKYNKVFEVEVSGKSKVFDQFKQRFEKQTIIREILKDELKELVKGESNKLSYDLYHAIFPVNPLTGEAKEVTEEIKDLLDEWINVNDSVHDSVMDFVGNSVWDSVGDSVMDSVWVSVWYSVRDSVWDSVRDSVWDSVRDSVRDSTYVYIGSLFPEIKKWKDVKHKKGVYPFQSAVDLWNKGFVPSFNGTNWILHSGENLEIVYEKERNNVY